MLLGCLLATASVQAAPSSTAPGSLPASPAPITPRTDGLPRELQEWVPWAMQGHEMLACPSRHDQAGSRACVWPEHLAVVIDGRQARFTLAVTVYGAPAAVMLPGEAGSWPTEVRNRQGQTLVVTGGSDQPQVLLPAGQHVLTGTLQWQADPQLVRVPAGGSADGPQPACVAEGIAPGCRSRCDQQHDDDAGPPPDRRRGAPSGDDPL